MVDAETFAESKVDRVLRTYQVSPIQYFPYESGVADVYGQRDESFGTPVTLIGRAILTPTPEQLSMIGNDEKWDIAFLFSRLVLVETFPSEDEGEWLDTSGQMGWNNRRFKIEKVHQTMQVKTKFLGVVVLANSIEGERDG